MIKGSLMQLPLYDAMIRGLYIKKIKTEDSDKRTGERKRKKGKEKEIDTWSIRRAQKNKPNTIYRKGKDSDGVQIQRFCQWSYPNMSSGKRRRSHKES
jgi:hypothetical protein